MSSTLSAGAHCAALLLHCRSAVTMKSLPTCDPACLTTSCPGTDRGCGQTQHNSYPACRPAQPPSRRFDEHTTNRQDLSTFVVSLNRSRRSREHSLSQCFAPASLSCSLPLLGSRRTFRMRVEFHSVLSELTTLVKFDSSQDMRVLCMSM